MPKRIGFWVAGGPGNLPLPWLAKYASRVLAFCEKVPQSVQMQLDFESIPVVESDVDEEASE